MYLARLDCASSQWLTSHRITEDEHSNAFHIPLLSSQNQMQSLLLQRVPSAGQLHFWHYLATYKKRILSMENFYVSTAYCSWQRYSLQFHISCCKYMSKHTHKECTQ